MRVGQNPAKSVKSVAQPQDITVAVVTYIPTVGGYYAQSLDVLKVCLTSIWENADLPFDLMIFDNGSCPEVRDYLTNLRDMGRIQYLILSEKNVGKAGAWNFIFGAAPGSYIAYADSDVYHYPGWLSPQIKLLEEFPNVGMVTGMPMWTPEEFSSSTADWLDSSRDLILERGKFLSWEDYWRHSKSLGANEGDARLHFDETENITFKIENRRYYVGAAHFQFVAPTSVLQEVAPIPSNRPMGQVRLLDIAINEKGYLRFCTPDWWVQHLGNTLGEFETQNTKPSQISKKQSTHWLWENKLIQRIVRWLYHRTFNILYRS